MTQEEFQQLVLAKLGKIEDFVEEQKKTNKKLEITYDGLIFMVQNEVITRLEGIADGIKLYTDREIRKHEKKYRHVLR